jgi:integrase
VSAIKKKKNRNGYEIVYRDVNNKLTSIYHSGSLRDARTLLARIESIVGRKSQGLSVLAEDTLWTASVGEKLRAKLIKRGLADAKAETVDWSVSGWMEHYITGRSVSDRTITNLKQTAGKLRTFLKQKRYPDPMPLDSFTAYDAGRFRDHLLNLGHAEATIRKDCSRVKQAFRAAIKAGHIATNPFDDVPTAAVENELRLVYVEPQRALDLLETIEDAQLRLMIIFTRFGGLRRHEVGLLDWSDVDFPSRRMRIKSNKNPPVRDCPLFADLARLIEPIAGSGKIIHRWSPDSNGPATMLSKHCKAIGFDLWQKPFQNARASLITDLLADFPVTDVCSWLGNSPSIALKHYAMARNANFDAATR